MCANEPVKREKLLMQERGEQRHIGGKDDVELEAVLFYVFYFVSKTGSKAIHGERGW